jgi:hypothetical protein
MPRSREQYVNLLANTVLSNEFREGAWAQRILGRRFFAPD